MRLSVEVLDDRWQPSATGPDPLTLAPPSVAAPVPVLTLPNRMVDGPLVAVEPSLAAGRSAVFDWGDGVVTPGTITAYPGLQTTIGTTRVLEADATYHVSVVLAADPPALPVVLRFDIRTPAALADGPAVVERFERVTGLIAAAGGDVGLWLARFAPTAFTNPDPATALSPPTRPAGDTDTPPTPPPAQPATVPVTEPASAALPPPAQPAPPPGAPFRAGAVRASQTRPTPPTTPVATAVPDAEAVQPAAERVGWTVAADRPTAAATDSPVATRPVGIVRLETDGVRPPNSGGSSQPPRPFAGRLLADPLGSIGRSAAVDRPVTPASVLSRGGQRPPVSPTVLHGVDVATAELPADDPVTAILAAYRAEPTPGPVFPVEPPGERSVWGRLAAVAAAAVGVGGQVAIRDRRPGAVPPADWLG